MAWHVGNATCYFFEVFFVMLVGSLLVLVLLLLTFVFLLLVVLLLFFVAGVTIVFCCFCCCPLWFLLLLLLQFSCCCCCSCFMLLRSLPHYKYFKTYFPNLIAKANGESIKAAMMKVLSPSPRFEEQPNCHMHILHMLCYTYLVVGVALDIMQLFLSTNYNCTKRLLLSYACS